MAAVATDIAALLRQVPLFQELPADDVQALAQIIRRRRAEKDTILFMEGDPGNVAYIVVSGRVDLVLEDLEGSQFLLYQLGPGGYFGEMALLDNKPRSATAVVAVDCELLTISQEQFLTFLAGCPDTMLRLLRLLVERLRIADEKVKTLGFLDVAGRLARTLLDLDRQAGQAAPIEIRHDQLAAMIGSSRQTVSTILGEWRSEEWITTGRGKITVLDRMALGDIAAM